MMNVFRGWSAALVLFAVAAAPWTAKAATSIVFTSVPGYGSFSNLQGKVYGVDPANYRVIVFINKGQQDDSSLSSWSSQPGCASNRTIFTTIQSNGTWTTDITNASGDQNATQIAAYVVPATSSPPCVTSSACLPGSILQQSVANTIATRSASNVRSFYWSGLNWWVKSGFWGPGPNNFSSSANNVFVDAQGRLHLRITNVNGNWFCSEIVSHRTLGFGSYYFYLDTSVDAIDPNITLGLFTWSNAGAFSHREIDVEGGRWGDPGDFNNAQFVVQPYNLPNHLARYRVPPVSTSSRHSFNWQSNSIAFTAVTGTTTLATWTYTSAPGTVVPPSCDENVRFNLWLNNAGGPMNGQEAEVIVSKFEFIGPDTDGDGMPDWWELAHGLKPNISTDAASDDDGDGFTNLQEYLAGTDPADSADPSAPVANFTGTPTTGTAPLTVTFIDSSTGTISNRFWNFGDGQTTNTTATIVTHTYTAVGTDTVTLVVSGLAGVSTNTKPDYITVPTALPSTVFTFAANLQDRFGNLAASNTVAVLVADTGNDGFMDPQPSFPVSLDAAWGTDDKVVGLWDLSDSLTCSGQDGALCGQVILDYTSGIAPGQKLQLYWFPSLSLASNTLGVTYYGKYADANSPPLDSSDMWALPAVGSAAQLLFFTANLGGSNPETAGQATLLTAFPSTPFEIWQMLYFGCTNCPPASASGDPDGDGQNNEAEYLSGTDPTNNASVFSVISVAQTNDDFLVTWQTAGNRTNVVQAAPDLSGSYSNISANILVTGSGDTQTNYLDVGAVTNAPFRSYRIRLVP